MELLLLRN